MTLTDDRYGEFLRELRTSRGLTQAQLADTTGISQPNLSAYENDRRSPTIDVFNRIAVACGYQVVADGGRRQVRCPLPSVGWFPDEGLPEALPDDPGSTSPPSVVGLSAAERGRLLHEVLRLGEAQA